MLMVYFALYLIAQVNSIEIPTGLTIVMIGYSLLFDLLAFSSISKKGTKQ